MIGFHFLTVRARLSFIIYSNFLNFLLENIYRTRYVYICISTFLIHLTIQHYVSQNIYSVIVHKIMKNSK